MVIEIAADPLEKIDVVLVGKPYKITPPKTALALRIAVQAKLADEDPALVMAALDTWIEKAFVAKDHKAIQKRLEDAGDALDIPHIVQLMEAIIEQQTGNPTT